MRRWILWLVLFGWSGAVSRGDIHYVSPTGSSISPYTNAVQAATNIQDAVNASTGGDTILVADGRYQLSTMITIDRDILLQSLHGPDSTTIDGGNITGCLYMTATNGVIDGFTVERGQGFSGVGGAYIAYGGTIQNCRIVNNRLPSGAGGGVFCYLGCKILNCIIASNQAADGGGANVYTGLIENCLIVDNLATNIFLAEGGGVSAKTGAVIRGTTIFRNRAMANIGATGGGLSSEGATVQNSIIYSNACITGANIFVESGPTNVVFTCTTPSVPGSGNITSYPQFEGVEAWNFRLNYTSPCIDAGSAAFSPTSDLDHRPRPADGDFDTNKVPDIGAYEYSFGVASQYLAANGTSVVVTWDSRTGCLYSVLLSSNLVTWTTGLNQSAGTGARMSLTNAELYLLYRAVSGRRSP